MDTGTIYHAFDTSSGMTYVGQTWDTLEDRRKGHLRDKRRNYPFQNALRKRPDDFVWTVLVSGLQTQSDMDAAEDAFVVELRTLWPNGFNLRRGGQNHRHTDENKNKMSKSAIIPWRGKKLSVEHRAKLSAAKIGKPSNASGKKWSEEAKIKLREVRRKQRHSEETKRKIGDAHRGMKRSPETCRRISEAKRKRNVDEIEL